MAEVAKLLCMIVASGVLLAKVGQHSPTPALRLLQTTPNKMITDVAKGPDLLVDVT